MGAGNFREDLTLRGMLTREGTDEAAKVRSFTLWTYDEQEYEVIFEDHRLISGLAAAVPTQVEFQGVRGLNQKGRKTFTVRKYKLIK